MVETIELGPQQFQTSPPVALVIVIMTITASAPNKKLRPSLQHGLRRSRMSDTAWPDALMLCCRMDSSGQLPAPLAKTSTREPWPLRSILSMRALAGNPRREAETGPFEDGHITSLIVLRNPFCLAEAKLQRCFHGTARFPAPQPSQILVRLQDGAGADRARVVFPIMLAGPGMHGQDPHPLANDIFGNSLQPVHPPAGDHLYLGPAEPNGSRSAPEGPETVMGI